MRSKLLEVGSGFLYDKSSKILHRSLDPKFDELPRVQVEMFNSENGGGYGFGRGYGGVRGCSSVEFDNEFPFELILYL